MGDAPRVPWLRLVPPPDLREELAQTPTLRGWWCLPGTVGQARLNAHLLAYCPGLRPNFLRSVAVELCWLSRARGHAFVPGRGQSFHTFSAKGIATGLGELSSLGLARVVSVGRAGSHVHPNWSELHLAPPEALP